MKSDDDELRADPESYAEHNETEPARPSRIIRIIQIVLAGILLGIVADGLLRRFRSGAARAHEEHTAQSSSEPLIAVSSGTADANASALPAALTAVLPTIGQRTDNEPLPSLNDIPVYLQLHRVMRETRAYQLGLTSRDALTQLAITSESSP